MQNAEGIDCKKSGEKVLTKGRECVILTEPLRSAGKPREKSRKTSEAEMARKENSTKAKRRRMPGEAEKNLKKVEKSFKKVLTKRSECGILSGSPKSDEKRIR